MTIIASPAIYDLGAWLEQLLAESTGKMGKVSFLSTASLWRRRQPMGTTASLYICGFTPEPDAGAGCGR